MAYFRILSIDGGGIRGVIPGQILHHLEKYLQQITEDETARLSDFFDMIAGTSTGGILSCAYLLPDENGRPKFTAQEVVNLYLERGEDIFKVPLYHKLRTMGAVIDEKYPANGLENALKDYFGDAKLSELLKPCLITSYDVENRKTFFFKQHRAKSEGDGKDYLVKHVARATSAAPTYFECAHVPSFDAIQKNAALIDGGIFANNPAMCAYAEARNFFQKTAKDMAVFSVNTGSVRRPYEYSKVKDWGLVQWPAPLIDIMMSAASETTDFQLKQLFEATGNGSQYMRLNIALPSGVNSDMDDASEDNLVALQQLGDKAFTEHKNDIHAFADTFLIPKKQEDLIA